MRGGPALSGATNRMTPTTARHGDAGRLTTGRVVVVEMFSVRWVRRAARSGPLIHVGPLARGFVGGQEQQEKTEGGGDSTKYYT